VGHAHEPCVIRTSGISVTDNSDEDVDLGSVTEGNII
jgi:hypothetical protein